MDETPTYSLESIYSHNTDLTKKDRELIKKAYFFAERAHSKQFRKSGEPYFYHLVATAQNLSRIKMDGTVIAAGLLHDSVEDGVATEKDLESEFGKEIAFLVGGVTKLGTVKFRGMRRHNESLRKLFVATSKDLRVLIIKFADRIHNLQTLDYLREDKQKRIAQESLEIYSQLAYRLGISSLSRTLGDLAFPYVYPEEYLKIQTILKTRSSENQENLEKVTKSIKKKFAENEITNFRITKRMKSLMAIYKKLLRKDGDETKLFDLIALRVILPDVETCYKALGIIHQSFRPMPGRIKDYIAFPKPNGYQSLHTTVFTGSGGMVEIQIRTSSMHEESEYGAASHIGYKAKTIGVDGISTSGSDWVSKVFGFFGKKEVPLKKGGVKENSFISWMNELAKHTEEDDKEDENFERRLKDDFFSDRIFVFTPNGEVIDLPTSSTPVDFAYQLHTKVGETTSGAKINGNMKALDTELGNGDIVEIITNKNASPNKKWLDFVKTNTAKRRIKNFWDKSTKKKSSAGKKNK